MEVSHAGRLVDHVRYTRRDLAVIANLTASLNVDGHRADLVILKAARAHAALEGRDQITERDILLAAELALPHRIKNGPFQETAINIHDLEERLGQARSDVEHAEMADGPEPDDAEASPVKKNLR